MEHDLAAAVAAEQSGSVMYEWARDLFPICRSLTGPGVRETLSYLTKLLPALETQAVCSGTVAFDWTVPDEWSIRDAFIADETGARVVDFRENNLHVVGYSQPVDTWLSREALEAHLYSLPDLPDAIPYVTSYYKRDWGFCLSHRERLALGPGRYRVHIDSTLEPGVLNYGELVLAGREKDEVLLSTNICHPSMANNEVSGLVVLTALAQWLSGLESRRYTYRILFLPETIGSIVYLSRHLNHLKEHTIAGFVVSCIGDEREYSYVASRLGGTLADRVAQHVLSKTKSDYKRYTFLDRGSDERQFCSPGVDLPVCAVMRSKHAAYPEYHTSLDNMSLITPKGMQGGFDALKKCLQILEVNYRYTATVPCEPQLGRRGLYPQVHTRESFSAVRTMQNVLAYSDGRDLIALADTIGIAAIDCHEILTTLQASGLVRAS